MIQYCEEDAGFSIRIEHYGERKLMRIGVFGRWNGRIAAAFRAHGEQLCRALVGQPWAAVWEADRFPDQKPYVLASLERMRREAVRHGMGAAAVLDRVRPAPTSAASGPRFDNEREAVAYALSCMP